MKAFIRLFALFFSLAIISCSIAACSGEDSSTPFESTRARRTKGLATTVTNDNTITTTAPAATTSPLPYLPDVPDSKLPLKKWAGEEFCILGHDHSKGAQYLNFEIWSSRDSDMVGSSIWYRNEHLKKNYNFKVVNELVPDTYSKAQVMYDAQDDRYDLIIYRPDKALAHASMHYLININELPYIDYNHPAWNTSVNNDLKINDALYFTSNYFLLQDKDLTYALIYNETLAESFNITGVKDLVLGGNWTVEKFNEYVKLAKTAPTKANNVNNKLGIVFDSSEYFASFFYGAGATIGTNTDGKISLYDPEDAANRISTYCDTLFDSTVSVIPTTPVSGANPDFAKGDSLFCATYFYKSALVDISNSKTRTCVLPLPKYDGDQEYYYSFVSPTESSVFAIPITVEDPEMIAFFLQAISEESITTSYDAYIQMRVLDSYEGTRRRIATLIMSSQKFDIAAGLNAGNLYTVLTKDLPEAKTNIYMDLYNSNKQNIETALDEYLANFD